MTEPEDNNIPSPNEDECKPPAMKKKKGWYKQAFKHEWLKEPDIRDWIKEHPTDRFSCICVMCECKLKNINKSALYAHNKSVKHKKNFDETKVNKWQSLDLDDNDSKADLFSNGKIAQNNRKRKRPKTKYMLDNGVSFEVNNEDIFSKADCSEENMKQIIVEATGADGTTVPSNMPGGSGSTTVFKSTNGNKYVVHCRSKVNRSINSDEIEKITNEVSGIIQNDMSILLQKDETLLMSVMEKKQMFNGKEGLARLAKMLVGHLSQHYLTEYSCKPESTIVTKLSAIEEQIEKSVNEMRNVKDELNSSSFYFTEIGVDDQDL